MHMTVEEGDLEKIKTFFPEKLWLTGNDPWYPSRIVGDTYDTLMLYN